MSHSLLRALVIVALVAASIWIAMLAALFLAQRSFIFPAPDGVYPPEAAGIGGIVSTRVAAADGTPVELWRWSSKEAGARRPLLLLFHGNGEVNAFSIAGKIEMAKRAGYDVAAMEYRGYNGNPGSPSEAALVADARAVVEALGSEGIAPSDIVLWGHSLGTGVAVQLAGGQVFRGMVLEAPFTAILDIARMQFPIFPVALMLRDPFVSRDFAPEIKSPTLILSGSEDSSIPPDHGRRLAALIPGARFVEIAGAGHNDMPSFPQEQAEIAAFLERLR